MATADGTIWRNCAILTPLTESGDVDPVRLAAHTRSLLDAGLDGVTLFGTTGEGPAFTVTQRLRTVEALLAAGIPARALTLGTGSAALGDAVELTAAAGRMGLRAVLASPPFYFKDATEEGLFAAFAALVERSGASAAPVMLYHIPSFTGLALRPSLLRRLADTYPGRIIGLKDSGIDLPKTLELLETCRDLVILVGCEEHIPDVLAAGGRGTICGLANLDPALVNRLLDGDRSAIPGIRALAAQLQGRQFVAAMKRILADRLGDPGWRRVAAPLLPLDDAQGIARAA